MLNKFLDDGWREPTLISKRNDAEPQHVKNMGEEPKDVFKAFYGDFLSKTGLFKIRVNKASKFVVWQETIDRNWAFQYWVPGAVVTAQYAWMEVVGWSLAWLGVCLLPAWIS